MSTDLYRLYSIDEVSRDGYPPPWHETLKHEVREAAGHRCLRCGHPYRVGEHGSGEWSPCDTRCTHAGPIRAQTLTGAWIDYPEGDDAITVLMLLSAVPKVAQWRILTVHHLDGNKANCRWWNLAALCQRCHLEIQGRVRMEQVYPFEHSEWFQPFAAGYYAHTYLGEDLSRAEVEGRLDELLALERLA